MRGSDTRPDASVIDVSQELARAREILKTAELSLQEQRESLPNSLREAEQRGFVKQQEFLEAISLLTARLELLETRRIAAERRVLKLSDEQTRTLKQLLCGGMAGVCSRSTVAPIDRVKILLQTQAVVQQTSSNKYGGIVGTLRTVVREEGFKKLWRGNGTNCIRIFPYSSLQFWSYDYYKGLIMRKRVLDRIGMDNPLARRFLSGACAGTTAAALTYPLDLIRIRQATNTNSELASIPAQARNILAEGGLRAMYKGFTPTVVSLSPFIAINFATMDTLKQKFMPKEVKSELQRSTIVLSCGATSAVVAQSFCYPLDTVRRRMQVKGSTYTSMGNAYSTIIAKEGLAGLYKGIMPNTVKIVPNNGMRWLAYTYFCKMMDVQPRKK